MPHTSHQNQDQEESLVTADQVTGLCDISHFPHQCENNWPKLTLASDWPGCPFRHLGIQSCWCSWKNGPERHRPGLASSTVAVPPPSSLITMIYEGKDEPVKKRRKSSAVPGSASAFSLQTPTTHPVYPAPPQPLLCAQQVRDADSAPATSTNSLPMQPQ